MAQGSESLKEVEVYSIPRDTCRVRYEFLESYSYQPFPVTENMICVGILNVGGKIN